MGRGWRGLREREDGFRGGVKGRGYRGEGV